METPVKRAPSEGDGENMLCGILAKSPDEFCNDEVPELRPFHNLKELSLTAIGIKTGTATCEYSPESTTSREILPIIRGDNAEWALGVALERTGRNQYLRLDSWNLLEAPVTRDWISRMLSKSESEIFLHTQVPLSHGRTNERCFSSNLILSSIRNHAIATKVSPGLQRLHAWPMERYDGRGNSSFQANETGITVYCASARLSVFLQREEFF